MNTIGEHLALIRSTLPEGADLVCVSKFQPMNAIYAAYEAGERDFGESRVQELVVKYEALPKDIRWHFIGHLQTNKVRLIIPFIHLIQSVDSERLLDCINREAEKAGRRVNVLLELHAAAEESKTGFTPEELEELVRRMGADAGLYPYAAIRGVMGMATNTDDEDEWRRCFRRIAETGRMMKSALENRSSLSDTPLPREPMIISMGMSEDYRVAIEEGSTMVRIGSSIFGARNCRSGLPLL